MKKTFIRFLIVLIISIFGYVYYNFTTDEDNAANTHQDTLHIAYVSEKYTQK